MVAWYDVEGSSNVDFVALLPMPLKERGIG